MKNKTSMSTFLILHHYSGNGGKINRYIIVRDGVLCICYQAVYITRKQEVTIKLLKTITACHNLTKPKSDHRDQEHISIHRAFSKKIQ